MTVIAISYVQEKIIVILKITKLAEL